MAYSASAAHHVAARRRFAEKRGRNGAPTIRTRPQADRMGSWRCSSPWLGPLRRIDWCASLVGPPWERCPSNAVRGSLLRRLPMRYGRMTDVREWVPSKAALLPREKAAWANQTNRYHCRARRAARANRWRGVACFVTWGQASSSLPALSASNAAVRVGSRRSRALSRIATSMGRRIVQHSGEAVFDGFERKFPAISAIYFAQDDANDIDKSLQGCTSLAGFLMVIVGRWKKAVDMCNELVTENEGPFIGWTDGHAAPLTALLHRAAISILQ
jgi:hypothetical protein